MKKIKIIRIVTVCVIFSAIIVFILLHNNGIFYHPSILTETINTKFCGRIVYHNGTYYQYKKADQRGIYILDKDGDHLLFESKEIFSLALYENTLVGLSKNIIYIYNIPQEKLYLIENDELKPIFTEIGFSQELGFYDSFRLLADEEGVWLYCITSDDAFVLVDTIKIFPEIADSQQKSVIDTSDKAINHEYFFTGNYFVTPLQINADNSNIVCVAVQAQSAGKINFYKLPFVYESLYKQKNDVWERIYTCKKNERIIYADDITYVIYDHQNGTCLYYSIDGELLETAKCKKLRPFGTYTYQTCNGKIFVFDNNYELYDYFDSHSAE